MGQYGSKGFGLCQLVVEEGFARTGFLLDGGLLSGTDTFAHSVPFLSLLAALVY